MQFLQFKLQSADSDRGSEIFCLFIRFHRGNLCIAVRDYSIYPGSTDDASVIVNCQRFSLAVCLLCGIGKFLLSFFCHCQVNNILGVAERLILLDARLSILDIGTGQHDGAVCQQLINRLIHNVSVTVGAVCVLYQLTGIVRISVRICLGNKIQSAGTSQLL